MNTGRTKTAVASHEYIYTGDSIYLTDQNDPNATRPEPDDTMLDEYLKQEQSYYENDCDIDEYKSLVDKYDRPEQAEQNDTFRKIRSYCLKNKLYEDYYNLLTGAIYGHTLKDNYASIVYSALDIPPDYVLPDSDWDEIADCFDM